VQFAVNAVDVRVDGMRRNTEVDGDGVLGVIVEDAAQDLQFAGR